MRRLFFIILIVVLSAGVWEMTSYALHSRPEIQPQATNLLENPGFEGDYYPWFGINEVQVAHGWTPWWRTRTDADPPAYYFKPEYKKADGYVFPNRVHGGAAAQQWFTFHATHQAGMYQQVFGVTPGTRYRFTVWAQVWSSAEDNPDVSIDPAYPHLRVGIDPTGNWNPWADTVIWSDFYHFFDHWEQLAVEAVAQNDVITVFMYSNPNWPVKHNDMYWDDAALVAVGEGNVPPPTAPPAATNTPAAPPPPTPTCAPAPSDWVAYVVQRGDTLFRLATSRGTTVERVVSVNCLSSTTIRVGQRLLLPPLAATATPAAPTFTPKPTATTAPTATPTSRPSATPTVTAVPPSPTAAPPTATPTHTPVPVAQATPTLARATLAPPPTSTPGAPVAPPTSPPSGGGGRPCGTIAVSAGIVLTGGFFRYRRRK